MICVYPANCTDFSTNGNGTLAPLSAEVTETLNGEYELTLVHADRSMKGNCRFHFVSPPSLLPERAFAPRFSLPCSPADPPAAC